MRIRLILWFDVVQVTRLRAMKTALIILCVISLVCGDGGDLDSLLSGLGGPPPGKKPPTQPIGIKPTQTQLPQPIQVDKVNAHCVSEEGVEGECVSYYLCENGKINKDGEGIIDIRFNAESPCQDYLETCCSAGDVVKTPITPKPPAVKATGCGIRNVDGVGYRIKGDKDNEAQFGEFPWMAAILRSEKGDKGQSLNVYQCGGSLIHPKVVLTAAHCVTSSGKPLKLKVRLGEWDTQTKNELRPYQDRNVVNIIKHEQYYSGALYNDIALLILESPVDDDDHIGVVCLPPKSAAAPPNECVASGWGKDVFGKEGKYQVILKKVELPIVERSKCQRILRKTRLGNRFELHKSFICAGGEPGRDTCKGDGGSPLACPLTGYPDRYMQSGIVAWGIGCNENIPGVYVNIAFLREWIDEKLRDNHIDMTPYQLH